MTQREMTRREAFNFHVKEIRKGFLESSPNHETRARELAQQYGFPIQAVEDALQIGIPAAFATYVKEIKWGGLSYEAPARRLMERYNFSPRVCEALEEALPIGRQALFDVYVDFIRNGEIGEVFSSSDASHIKKGELKYESEARTLATENLIPLRSLEEALPIGRQVAIDRCIKTIRRGVLVTSHEEYARRLIEKQEKEQRVISLQALDETLPIGRRAEFDFYLTCIKSSKQRRLDLSDLLEEIARQYAMDYGFPIREVEDVLQVAKTSIKKEKV